MLLYGFVHNALNDILCHLLLISRAIDSFSNHRNYKRQLCCCNLSIVLFVLSLIIDIIILWKIDIPKYQYKF
jgi:hypothetical protein